MTAKTTVTRHLKAPRHAVYDALIDSDAVARWKFPSGMTCQVHSFDGREGGTFRISLTYSMPGRTGKTSAQTDTYHGTFAKLVHGELVVEVDEFETDDPALAGKMTITISLADDDGGTLLTAVHEGLPDAVSTADNEAGWNESLDRLAALVER